MRAILLALILCLSSAVLSGCCTDDMNAGLDIGKCDGCSTCPTCGYGNTYTDSGWY